MEKVCILGANFDTGNLGVGALTMGAIQCINYAYPKAGIFIMDYSTNKDMYHCEVNQREIEVPLIPIRFTWKIFLMNNIFVLIILSIIARIFGQSKAGAIIISHNNTLRVLKEADIVASIAGGDSFSDIYGFSRFVYVILPQILAIIMGKKLIMLPQTLGPFKRPLTRFIANKLMIHSHLILSRDHAGIEETRLLIKNMGRPGVLNFCYDMGFILDSKRPKGSEINDIEKIRKTHIKLFGVNVSGLLLMGGYDRKNMFNLKADYGQVVHKVLDLFLSIDKAAIILVPHVLGDSSESDITAINKIYATFNNISSTRLFKVNGAYNQNEIKYIIGMCDLFVGSRMHACIAALSQAIPTVSIAYSKKFIGVMQSIDMADTCVDPRAEDMDTILRKVQAIMNDHDKIRAFLIDKMPQVKKRVLELFKQ